MYGPVKECHCGSPEFSVAGCYANVHCWARSLVIRVLKDSLLELFFFFPTEPPFSTILFDLTSDVKSQTFFEWVHVWKTSPVFWSPTLLRCTLPHGCLKSLLLSLTILHRHNSLFLHLSGFLIPTLPSGHFLVLYPIKAGTAPASAAAQKEQRCFKRIP